jgi:hypothetical protein
MSCRVPHLFARTNRTEGSAVVGRTSMRGAPGEQSILPSRSLPPRGALCGHQRPTGPQDSDREPPRDRRSPRYLSVSLDSTQGGCEGRFGIAWGECRPRVDRQACLEWGVAMSITNIFPGVVSANIAGPTESSVTIARQGGPGWAFAQTSLVWSRDLGRAFAWISAVRTQRSPDQIDNAIFPDPGGAFVNRWFANCLSVTFSLRIEGGGRASAVATLSPWQ